MCHLGEDKTKTNARIFDGSINDICRRLGQNPVQPLVLFYDKLTEVENVLVSGEYGQLFSEPGDIGAPVFSRPLESKQNTSRLLEWCMALIKKRTSGQMMTKKNMYQNRKINAVIINHLHPIKKGRRNALQMSVQILNIFPVVIVLVRSLTFSKRFTVFP